MKQRDHAGWLLISRIHRYKLTSLLSFPTLHVHSCCTFQSFLFSFIINDLLWADSKQASKIDINKKVFIINLHVCVQKHKSKKIFIMISMSHSWVMLWTLIDAVYNWYKIKQTWKLFEVNIWIYVILFFSNLYTVSIVIAY